jgi:LysM repeat protein
MVSSCDAFYKIVSGDSCNAVADKYNITAANFHAWNPAVGSSCTMLIIGDYVCVGVLPSSTTTTTTTTASTRTGVVTPSPI